MQKVVRAAMAAVAVTKSRLTSCTQSMYAASVTQRSWLVGGHTQVPPESLVMVELTLRI